MRRRSSAPACVSRHSFNTSLHWCVSRGLHPAARNGISRCGSRFFRSCPLPPRQSSLPSANYLTCGQQYNTASCSRMRSSGIKTAPPPPSVFSATGTGIARGIDKQHHALQSVIQGTEPRVIQAGHQLGVIIRHPLPRLVKMGRDAGMTRRYTARLSSGSGKRATHPRLTSCDRTA